MEISAAAAIWWYFFILNLQDPAPLPYLTETKRTSYDIPLQVFLSLRSHSEFQSLSSGHVLSGSSSPVLIWCFGWIVLVYMVFWFLTQLNHKHSHGEWDWCALLHLTVMVLFIYYGGAGGNSTRGRDQSISCLQKQLQVSVSVSIFYFSRPSSQVMGIPESRSRLAC